MKSVYFKSKTLLSPTELDFYKRLVPLADERGCVVFPKVRLADLVWIPKHLRLYAKLFGGIKAKHIDFVVCDAKTLEIRGLIELDDATHRLPHRESRDRFVNHVIKRSGHPFIRCKSPEQVCHLI